VTGGADSVTLGNTTDFAAASVNPEILERIERENWRADMLSNRYKLQAAVRELLPDYRASYICNRPIADKLRKTLIDNETGKAHYKNIAKCGSVWVCPVCAAKISMERMGELQEAIEKGKEKGLENYFVTFTVRHSREDSADWLLGKLTAAKRWMKKQRSYKRFRKLIGDKGSVTGLEDTWGFANGWHFHYHMLYFAEKSLNPDDLESELYELWRSALERQGLDCSREHGVKVLKGDDEGRVAGYMTKGGLSNELTGQDKKKGHKGHFTPFQLLFLYNQGEAWAGRLFQEHADATKGKSSLRYSRGLRDYLGLSKEMSDQEAAERERNRNVTVLFTFTSDQEKIIRYSGRPEAWGEILTAAEGGRACLLHYLKLQFGIEPKPPP
jgi:rubrerythrin